MKILLAGGAGYIGSHTCVELLEKGDIIINEAIEDYKAGKISDDVLKYKSTW